MIGRGDPRLCFWSVGTIEAHDQGPLGTDVIAPEKLTTDLAEELALVYMANPEIVPQTWDGSRAFRYREGLKAYPSPRSAIRYSEEQAKPFTPEKAAAYYEELKKRISEVIKDILSGWEAFNQPGKKEA